MTQDHASNSIEQISERPSTILEDRLVVAVRHAARMSTFIRSRTCGVWVASLSFVAVAFYVFAVTPYGSFVFSDMGHYWNSAMERLQGQELSDSQFIAWPPLYHIFLAEFFRILQTLGLESWIRLETALLLNPIALAISVYAFHRIATYWFDSSVWIAVTVLLYAFGFPSLYFSAFLLSGNLAVPLIVISVAVALLGRGWWSVAAAATLFAAATAIRPAFGPFGIAFVAAYLVRDKFSWAFVARAAVFSATFFALIALASVEVSRISMGRVNGLSANGGLDFFLAMSHFHRVELRYDNWHFVVAVPASSMKPENGVYHTNIPFYYQSHYFDQGWEVIKQKPSQLLENFTHIRHLFFADMLPSRYDAPGFGTLMPIWDWFKFVMFVALGLYVWMWRTLGSRGPTFWLLTSIIALTLVESFFFTGEPRYTYSILFAFYLLFFKLVETISKRLRRWIKAMVMYAGVLLLGTAATASAMYVIKLTDPPSVSVKVTPTFLHPSEKIENIPVQQFDVGRILFPYARDFPITHRSGVALPSRPSRVDLYSVFDVRSNTPVTIQFEINSSWPTELWIDGRSVAQVSDSTDFFSEVSAPVTLYPGKHQLFARFHYAPYLGGFAVSYHYREGERRERETVGLDTPKVAFLPVSALSPDESKASKRPP